MKRPGMSGGCTICSGTGEYPIIDQFGCERYAIQCPECGGDGLSQAEFEQKCREQNDRARYEAAMREARQ